MARKGKKYREAVAKLDRRPYALDEAVGLIDQAVAIYEENISRFGKRTDWGKASAERLIEIMAPDPAPESPLHEEDL